MRGCDDRCCLEHTTIALQRHLNLRGESLRNDKATRKTCDACTLDSSSALLRDARSTVKQVVAKGSAVLLAQLLADGSIASCHLLLGLPAADILVTLLRLDSLVSLVVVREHSIPALLLLCGHLTTIGSLTQLINAGVDGCAFLFE